MQTERCHALSSFKSSALNTIKSTIEISIFPKLHIIAADKHETPSPGLHGEVPRRLRGCRGGGDGVADVASLCLLLRGRRLDEEAVVPLVHVLALLDDAEHRLVHLVALHARLCVDSRPTRPVPDLLLKFKVED